MKTRNYGVMIAALSVLFSFALPGVVNANNKNGDSTPVEVKYIGQLNNQPLFQLNIKNDGNEEYTISITDEEGTRLYYDVTKGKDYSKRFLVNEEEIGGNALKLEVRSKSSKTNDVFQLKSNNRFVQEGLVTKL